MQSPNILDQAVKISNKTHHTKQIPKNCLINDPSKQPICQTSCSHTPDTLIPWGSVGSITKYPRTLSIFAHCTS